MTLNDRQKIGLAILAAIAVALLVWYFFVRDEASGCEASTTVSGYSSPIKARFFENTDLQKILCEEYDLATDITPMDTGAILCEPSLDDVDVLWVGDQSQISIYEACRNRSDFNRNILLSPLVIYSWTSITEALISEGVVQVGDDGVYRADMLRLLALIETDQSWSDIGFPNRPSKIIVQPTDPNESTSGQMFAGLLADTMNCLEVVDDSTVAAVLPGVHQYFVEVGFMQTASAELFRLYMSQGEGSYPLVSLLESQIIESLAEDPDMVQQVADDIRMLYPEPTVWLTHPMIGVTEEGRQLAEAMLDPEIQALAWPIMGFRPSVPGVQIDLSVVPIPGVQENITSVVNLPGSAIMSLILDSAQTTYVVDPNAPPRRDCIAENAEQATPVAVLPEWSSR